MSDAALSLLAKLLSISRIDSILAQIGVERRRLETQLKEQQQRIAQTEKERASKHRIHLERKSKQQQEEKTLNEERQKLMDRRKALSSFSGQKIQQAAEREINATAEMLNSQEEALIKGLSDLEYLEKDCAAIDAKLCQQREELAKADADYQATLVNLEERQRVKEARKAEIVATVDRASFSTYTRVRDRFPQNAVVAVKDKSCSGCFQTLVPQTVVLVAKAESIIKCPGCSRILCLESHLEESKEE